MEFNLTAFVFNPFVLIFLVMTLGNLFGRIKFGRFNFGITGTLFVGLIVGYFLTKYGVHFGEASKYYMRAQSVIRGKVIGRPILFFSLLIFIIATGLLAAKDMKYAIKKFGRQFVMLAILVPFIGAVSSYGLSKLFKGVSPYQITGTYTGALTSSSGLAAAMESSEVESKRLTIEYPKLEDSSKTKILAIINKANIRDAELQHKDIPETLTVENTAVINEKDAETFILEAKAGVGVGHSIGYPFGVLFLILGVNFIPKLFRFSPEEEKKKYFEQKKKDLAGEEEVVMEEVKMDFVGFSLAGFLGYFLGSIKFHIGPLGTLGLGSIGGSIIVSLILGSIGKIGPINFRMNSDILGKMRTYFLAIFLAGTGVNYGYRVVQAISGDGISIVIVSILVAIISILVAFIVGHYIFHINWMLLSGAITGGMTSAPGLGAAIDAVGCDEPAIAYGATQPLATLFMVIFSIIIHKLPI